MHIKHILQITFFLFLSCTALADKNEHALSIEVIKSTEHFLSKNNIAEAAIKLDAENRPYIELTLTQEGVEEIMAVTSALKGSTVNIWLGEHPIMLSSVIHSAIRSSVIRVSARSLKEAEDILKYLKST